MPRSRPLPLPVPHTLTAQQHSGQVRSPLELALEEFRSKLTAADRAQLQARTSAPDTSSVINLITKLDAAREAGSGRCLASRLSPFLESVQGFTSIISTFVSSNPATAALVWGSVQLTVELANRAFSQFKKLSELLMWIGQICPRFSAYQQIFDTAPRVQLALCNFYTRIVKCCTDVYLALQASDWQNLLNPKILFGFGPDAGRNELQKLADIVKEEIALANMQVQDKDRQRQMTHFSDQEARRKRKERQALLDRLSTYDQRISFEQNRLKRCAGTAEWLSRLPEFDDWLSLATSSVLWFRGKLGCGKSVLMSYAVGELSLRYCQQDTRIIYVFHRFNDIGSASASAILRSLIRQCLDTDSLAPNIQEPLEDLLRDAIIRIDQLRRLLRLVLKTFSQCIIVIDGLDDFIETERRKVIDVLYTVVETARDPVKLLLSSRDAAPKGLHAIRTPVIECRLPAAHVQQDIASFVECALTEKIECDQLQFNNPELPIEIARKLCENAQEMFLWVTLSLDEICRQSSDEAIRQSLACLPRSLTELYRQILSRIETSGKTGEALACFKLIAAARRPLTLLQLQEAMAVEPCAQFSNRDRFIHDITQITQWCQGLVIYEEINSSIQFTHSTIFQTLTDQEKVGQQHWSYVDVAIAQKELGVICTTYLNFNDFKTQLQKRSKLHDVTAESLLRSSQPVGLPRLVNAIMQRLKPTTHSSSGVTQVLLRAGETSKQSGIHGGPYDHPFLDYAAENWLSHTAAFNSTERIWRLWESLLPFENELAKKPYTAASWDLRSRELRLYIVNENHCALFSFIQSSSTSFEHEAALEICQYAAGQGAAMILDLVLENSDSRYKCLSIALEAAARAGHLGSIERLLAARANVYAALAADHGCTALQAAAGGGHLKVVERLLAAGADVNAANAGYDGRTALQAAAEAGHLEVVEMLLAAGANVNVAPAANHGRTALQAAAGGGHLEVVERLLAAGADVNAANAGYDGRTALQGAAEAGHLEVIERLLAAGANVNVAPAADHGCTALQGAAEAGHLEVIERLLTAGADVNATPAAYGRTALQGAAEAGHREVVEMLLAAAADVNAAPAAYGRTALQGAAEAGHLEVIEMLLAAGADVHAAPATDHGRTALQAAAEAGHLEVVERLLAAGADVNAALAADYGRTALQAAAEAGHLEIVERLLAAGADVNAAPSMVFGCSALAAAEYAQHLQVVKRLEAAGAIH